MGNKLAIKLYLRLVASVFVLSSSVFALPLIDILEGNHTNRAKVYRGETFEEQRDANEYTDENNSILGDEGKLVKRIATPDEKAKTAKAVFGAAWTDLTVDGAGAISSTQSIDSRAHKNPYKLCDDVIDRYFLAHYIVLRGLDDLARNVVGNILSSEDLSINRSLLTGYEWLFAVDGFDEDTIFGWLNEVHVQHFDGLKERFDASKRVIQQLAEVEEKRQRAEVARAAKVAAEETVRLAATRTQVARFFAGKLADIDSTLITPDVCAVLAEIAADAGHDNRFDAAVMLMDYSFVSEEDVHRKEIALAALRDLSGRADAGDYNPNTNLNPIFAKYIVNAMREKGAEAGIIGAAASAAAAEDEETLGLVTMKAVPFNILKFRDEKKKLFERDGCLDIQPVLRAADANTELYECLKVIASSEHNKSDRAAAELLYCLCDSNPAIYRAFGKQYLENMDRNSRGNSGAILKHLSALEGLVKLSPEEDIEGNMPFYDAIRIIVETPQLTPVLFDGLVAISYFPQHPKWQALFNTQNGFRSWGYGERLNCSPRLRGRMSILKEMVRENLSKNNVPTRRITSFLGGETQWNEDADISKTHPEIYDAIIGQILAGPVGRIPDAADKVRALLGAMS